jgi:thymidylate kinase
VKKYYLGSTQPSSETWILQKWSRIYGLFFAVARKILGGEAWFTIQVGNLGRVFESMRLLGEGRDRYQRYIEGKKMAAQGWIVVCDRFPVESVIIEDHSLDGPRIRSLYHDQEGKLGKKLIDMEENLYQGLQYPDHLFVLQVSPDVSKKRKPDHRPRLIDVKSQSMQSLSEENKFTTQIDADQSLEAVLLKVKSVIWEMF